MRLSKLFACLATVAVLSTSCAMMGTGTGTATPTAAAGNTAGSALLGLFTQYATDGRLDMSNVNNIINLATLASNLRGVNNNQANTSFLNGLIAGSNNLVNNNNAGTVLNALSTLSALNVETSAKATQAAKAVQADAQATVAQAQAATGIDTKAQNVATAVSTLSTLFNTLKK